MMIIKKTTFLLSFLLLTIFTNAQKPIDYTVQAWAEVNKATPSITIKWKKTTGITFTGYIFYRKAKSDLNWTNKGSKTSSDSSWTDTDVQVGVSYEYRIYKMNVNNPVGVTYLLSGIEIPVLHSRGNCLVVVEKSLMDSIPSDVDNYLKDIAADGWKVYSVVVKSSDSVQKVRREIKKNNVASGGLKSLVILGHVPVPYSGDFGQGQTGSAPDGHVPDHNGCWPTDAYYSIDADNWQDEITNTAGITRAQNKNLPNDSKWDNTFMPGDVDYYCGRIDLSNMPKFNKSEIQLTKQYLKKAHDYKYKITKTAERGVVEDNFGGGEAFSSTGWRDFSVMFGPQNVTEADYFTTCQTENLLFAYGCGAGSYTSCSGVGTTDNFVTQKGAIFNMLFGSYFGDWDVANSFLRAPLAATENGLTNAWSGRPWWHNHQMALGEPIGYCTRSTQNNKGTYEFNIYANSIPIGLMGDPTLRLHMIAPPSNLTLTASTDNKQVNLSWTASTEAGVIGYYIYRAGNAYSNNFPINNTPITTTNYTDLKPYNGTNYYLVKAVKLTTSASGSYFNLSHGAASNISNIIGGPVSLTNISKPEVSIFPNPSKEFINLQFNTYTNDTEIFIYDIQGQLIHSHAITLDDNLKSNAVFIGNLSAGIYYVKNAHFSSRFIKE
jgi:hypothetical protein